MTGCKKLLSELSNYLDGEMDSALRTELEEHITRCPKCFVIFDTTRKTIQIYQGCCEPYPLPEGLQDKLQQALRKKYEASSEQQR